MTIRCLNELRERYLSLEKQEGMDEERERVWLNIWQLLPQSFVQRRTVMLNYEVLANICRQRKNHRLPEWREFCDLMATMLPEPWLFTGNEK